MQNASNPVSIGGVPFPSLFHEVRNEWVLMKLPQLHLFTVMSIILQESHGNDVFCPCDQQYKDNAGALCHTTGLGLGTWLQYISPVPESGNLIIPKFRIEPAYFDLVPKKWGSCKYSPLDRAMLACSWGLGQQMGYEYTAHLACEDRIPSLRRLIASRPDQIHQCFKYFTQCLDSARGDYGLACTRYNAGPGAKEISKYGITVMKLAASLQQRTPQTAIGGF